MSQPNFKKPLLTASILIALSSPTLANEQVDETVVVTATKTNQALEDVAASVAVITDAEIESNMSNNIADVFDYTPGVTIENSGRQGIQGINIRGLSGNRVQIVVDGVIQPDQYDPGGDFIRSGRLNFDPEMLKSVEVVKGSASSLYGSDAIAGIVAFSTKSASDFLEPTGNDFGGYVKLGYHSADKTFSESVALANRSGSLESLVAYTRKDGNELNNFGEPDNQDYSSDNLLVKLGYDLNESHSFEVRGSYVKGDTKTDVTNKSYKPYKGHDVSDSQSFGIKHTWNANLALFDNLVWHVDWVSQKEKSDTHRTKISNGNVQHKDYIYRERGFQGEIQGDKFISGESIDHFIVYGVSFKNKDIHNQNDEINSIGADKTVYYMPNAKEQRYGAFLQDDMLMLDGKLRLTPGIRFDSYNTDPNGNVATGNSGGYTPDSYTKYSDSAVTGRVGAVYELNQTHKAFAQVSQGFRAPNFKELFYSFSNLNSPFFKYKNIPNPDLKAETSISYELGLRSSFENADTEFVVFYNDYDNFIESKTVQAGGGPVPHVFQHVNVDKATIKGVELSSKQNLSAVFGLPEGFKSGIAGVYTEGSDGEGERLDSVNPWQALAKLNYDSPSDSWGTSLKMVYTASKKTSSSPSFDMTSATIFDVTGYYKPTQDLTLRAGIFNLTDRQYYNWNDVRSLSAEDVNRSQPERNFAITAKYDF
ncbi:Heme receptor [Vibrio nigripulchritudo MADA3029]|uniref:TonB-dependent hemoglobin/transferrin/lactoferrin family receptor n=1 Tax=Vibrio nigripulchritudo TaxID=28173 RepID=UPI0003B1CC4D|nr:TonB-dependent hemoglobin/transferrin/lactoferrin family receptor [Vibrio nigripulchritudo]CCN50115.1 Heme receptor [Vibrio nigripulchritudo MADA3020]CCN54393.1 Heme receptor [Vibrio nigripulchritudo MADA3021]CCN58992.1 Heme receptor [Vibrio nigripulchritudo MADA3029]